MRYVVHLSFIALSVVGEVAVAQTAVPHTFTSGTPARAAEVNANFEALASAIDAVADRITRIEDETIAATDIVGTYTTANLQIGIDRPSGSTEGITYLGPFTFVADGTFTSTFDGHKNDDAGPGDDDGTISGNWTLSGSKLTLTGLTSNPVELHSAIGGRLLIGAFYGGDASYGHNNFIVLVRED